MSLYKRPNSNIWWANIAHPDFPRIRRSTGTADRVEAQRIHDEIRAELWSAPKIKGRTWGQAVAMWASVPGRGDPDIMAMSKFARIYRDRQITQVNKENLLEALSFCKTPGTYMRYRGRISAILNMAKDHGWLREVPKLPAKRLTPKRRDWLTEEEWGRLYAHLPEHQRRMALFAVETGLRQANVLSLQWSQVDLDRRLVWYEAEDMKGRRSISVPLSDTAYELLKALHDDKATGFVFAYKGRPIKEIKTAFHRACVDAELGRYNEDGSYEGFTWHGLRHTWATWHVQNGTPLGVLKELGGWSDMRMVLNYGHHTAGHVASYANNVRKKPNHVEGSPQSP